MLNEIGFLVAGTPIWTDHGLVPIEEIKIGDKVLSKSEITGEITYKPVAQTFIARDQEILHAKLVSSSNKDGECVTTEDFLFATTNQPLWVLEKGWTSLGKAYGGWDVHRLARHNDEFCEVLDVSPVYEVPGQQGVGAVIVNESDEQCFTLEFDGNIDRFPLNGLNERFNGATVREADDYEYIGDFYIDEPSPSRYRNFRTAVYQIEVEDFHTYFVGELGLWVHNFLSDDAKYSGMGALDDTI